MSNANGPFGESGGADKLNGMDGMSNGHHKEGAPLGRSETIGSISLTPEQFDRLYLQPQNKVSGDLRKTFGNPTPVGLGGFLLALTPLVMQFMGWRGTSTANGLPTFGSYLFLGGMLAILASIGEFILGNTFPSIFFGTFGAFFLTYGVELIPYMGAVTTFAPPGTVAAAMATTDAEAVQAMYLAGAQSVPFNSSIAFLSLMMGLMSFIHLIAALRTNVFFVIAFASLVPTFCIFSASRFAGADGDLANFEYYQVVAGGCGFVTCCAGWYLFLVEILVSVDFPFIPPVFDLSGVIPGGSTRAQKKADAEHGVQHYQ